MFRWQIVTKGEYIHYAGSEMTLGQNTKFKTTLTTTSVKFYFILFILFSSYVFLLNILCSMYFLYISNLELKSP